MAKPRIFVSSTYFDMRVVRADLERFIKEIGYEPVLFERGHVPYGKEEALEEYCYREISTCDVLVAIIGGKYGSQAKDDKNSITQKELKTAVELGKQVYIFVERSVHSEYKTYQNNKEVEGFKPASVNDSRVFKFLEEIYGLPAGNPVEPFEISDDITRYLREQWSGLFQRLLQESSRQREVMIIENLKSTASTLNNLVTFLTEERSKGDEAIKGILLSSHPAFSAIKKAAKIPYRVVFYTFDELNELLRARSFIFDDGPFGSEGFYEWDNHKAEYGVRVKEAIFDEDDKLRILTPEEWDDAWVDEYPLSNSQNSDDDLPF
ncbi:MAG: DUF4062 domain-containing protein [Spongiibacter marinus]|uniref:DUF4062 domain-containing protein n=1 Tax=Spongiibacter marinus TaxID=354246 RepID=UPI003C3A4FB8